MSKPKLTPQIAYNLAERLYEVTGERNARLESMIAQDRYYAYSYAVDVLSGPFPEAEPVFAQDSYYARAYVRDVLKTPEDRARFKEVQKWVNRS